MSAPAYKTLEDAIGGTPLVRLQRLPGGDNERRGNVILGKLEGNNPAGSVKDRPAISMIRRAEERGEIRPGDTLIEATSGNTGIALAMAAAIRGYRMLLIMPEDLSVERAQTMKAFGAELILTPRSGGMEYARDLAEQMQREGKGRVLDQFANADNPRIHYETTGPEIWADTAGRITHFVSAMGTTGTITGVSRYLKEQNTAVRIVGAQPAEGSRIPGIRKWPAAYLPKIYEPAGVDELVLVSQADAEDMVRRLAREEGLFAGISAAGACWVALQIAKQVENATVVFIVCDRGDRYLSTGVFPMTAAGRSGCAAPPAAGRTGTTRCRCWPPSSSAPTATANCCWRATRPGRGACSRSSPASWKPARRRSRASRARWPRRPRSRSTRCR
jgi:S-sulfo-L-cysteine synthase (O-acetyl-L-serine-dependent)